MDENLTATKTEKKSDGRDNNNNRPTNALPTRSQFSSSHRNHSGHTFMLLLILRPWE